MLAPSNQQSVLRGKNWRRQRRILLFSWLRWKRFCPSWHLTVQKCSLRMDIYSTNPTDRNWLLRSTKPFSRSKDNTRKHSSLPFASCSLRSRVDWLLPKSASQYLHCIHSHTRNSYYSTSNSNSSSSTCFHHPLPPPLPPPCCQVALHTQSMVMIMISFLPMVEASCDLSFCLSPGWPHSSLIPPRYRDPFYAQASSGPIGDQCAGSVAIPFAMTSNVENQRKVKPILVYC